MCFKRGIDLRSVFWVALVTFVFVSENDGIAHGMPLSDEEKNQLPWNPSNFPNPKRDIHLCGRGGKPSNICDPDNVLGSEKAGDRIEGILKDIWDGVPPYGTIRCGDGALHGYQVAVALMKKMEVGPHQTPAGAAEAMAKDLYAKWNVGDPKCSNGVVLMVAIDNRQVYISTGKGARLRLTDSAASGVIGKMKPYLRRGDYVMAITSAVVDIGMGLAGQKKDNTSDWIGAVVLFSIIAGWIGVRELWNWRNKRRYRECKSLLDKIKEEQENLRLEVWSSPKSCPICLEDFSNSADSDAHIGGNGKCGMSSRKPENTNKEEVHCDAEMDPESPSYESRNESAMRLIDDRVDDECLQSDKDEKIPITITCGHTFCEPCLSECLKISNKCPICRKEISDAGNGPSSSGPHPYQNWDSQTRERWHEEELYFRMRQLDNRYPGLVDVRRAQIIDPCVQEAQERRGASGNSYSFGGNSGGASIPSGGAGGSW